MAAKKLDAADRMRVMRGIVQTTAQYAINSATDPDKAIEAFNNAPDSEKKNLINLIRGKRFRSKSSESKAKYDALLNQYK